MEPIAPATSAYSWTGFYLGAQAGHGWGSSDYRGGIDMSDKPKGWFGGARTGYNYQFDNNLVLGAEADINGGELKDTHVLAAGNPGADWTTKQQWFGSARLRLGYAFDRFLPFIAGGLAFGNYKQDLSVHVAPLGSWALSHSATQLGWTLGAGLEYAVTDHWSVSAEYRYSDYGKKAFEGTSRHFAVAGTNGITLTESAHKIDLRTSDILLGANYKF